jgi:hypothetical protein
MSEAPAFLARFVLVGTLPGGEEWASGLWWTVNAAPANGPDFQSFVDEYAITAFGHAGWFQGQNVAGATWTGVKGYYHASNPGAPAVFAGENVFGSPKVGTGSGQEQPNQVCVVASTLTGQSGRSFRGRMYCPATNLGLTAGVIASGQVDAVASGLVDLIDAVRTATTWRPMVVSITKDVMTEIIQLRVDNKPDIQRRRANKLVSTYRNTSNL